MLNKNSALLIIILILITLTIGATFYRFFIQHDYNVYYDDYGESL
jgi:hypothetical protein